MKIFTERYEKWSSIGTEIYYSNETIMLKSFKSSNINWLDNSLGEFHQGRLMLGKRPTRYYYSVLPICWLANLIKVRYDNEDMWGKWGTRDKLGSKELMANPTSFFFRIIKKSTKSIVYFSTMRKNWTQIKWNIS